MARPRAFDEEEVVRQAAVTFAELGYNGCSIDDLLSATGLKRGSLYKAFGSKRNLFIGCLTQELVGNWSKTELAVDLVIVALRDLCSKDKAIRQICIAAMREVWKDNEGKAAQFLGRRLLSRLEI